MSSWWERKLTNDKSETSKSLPPVQQQRVTIPALAQQAQLQSTTPVNRQLPAGGQTDMGSAIRMWTGGDAHRQDGHLTCPRCSSKNVFSRSNGSNMMKPPAPRCFECGWNGIYQQADQASWAV